jgi:hypothetical protein
MPVHELEKTTLQLPWQPAKRLGAGGGASKALCSLQRWRPRRRPEGSERELNKFLFKNWSMSWMQNPGNFCARRWWKYITTAKKWSQQNYEASIRKMGSIGHTVSKLRSRQSSKVELKMPARTSPPETVSDLSGNWPGLVRPIQNYAQFLYNTEPFIPNLDSSATSHKMEWNLNIRVISTQGTSFKEVSSNLKIFLPILDELKKPRF